MKLYFFPTVPLGQLKNPYSDNYKKAISSFFEVVDDSKVPSTLNYPLLHFSFSADIFILNWIEGVAFTDRGFLKFILVIISLHIIRIRRKKIIWMLHNLQPHEGSNWTSRYIQKYLFNHSSLIIAHSKTACNYAKRRAKCDVRYFVHPVASPICEDEIIDVVPCDVVIWGSILPYKGVLEFLSKSQIQQSQLRIRIIGTCKDEKLSQEILNRCNDMITFENRKIGFSELKGLLNQCRYVLFPYVGSSVSSSGALIDTINLGGTPVGPNTGAFKDLSEEGVCLTYSNDKEMMDILTSNKMSIEECKRVEFIKNNSWQNFAKEISKIIRCL